MVKKYVAWVCFLLILVLASCNLFTFKPTEEVQTGSVRVEVPGIGARASSVKAAARLPENCTARLEFVLESDEKTIATWSVQLDDGMYAALTSGSGYTGVHSNVPEGSNYILTATLISSCGESETKIYIGSSGKIEIKAGTETVVIIDFDPDGIHDPGQGEVPTGEVPVVPDTVDASFGMERNGQWLPSETETYFLAAAADPNDVNATWIRFNLVPGTPGGVLEIAVLVLEPWSVHAYVASPSGDVDGSGGIRGTPEGPVMYFRYDNPEAGNWHVRLTGYNARVRVKFTYTES